MISIRYVCVCAILVLYHPFASQFNSTNLHENFLRKPNYRLKAQLLIDRSHGSHGEMRKSDDDKEDIITSIDAVVWDETSTFSLWSVLKLSWCVSGCTKKENEGENKMGKTHAQAHPGREGTREKRVEAIIS